MRRAAARLLYGSLHRLLELGDDVGVFPVTSPGPSAARTSAPNPSTTIARERTTNRAFISTHDEFMCRATGPQPPRPPNMELIVELNRGPFLGAQPPLQRVENAEGAVVLDVRDPDGFGAGSSRGGGERPVRGNVLRHEIGVRAPDRPLVIEAAPRRTLCSPRSACTPSASSTSPAGARRATTSARVGDVDELERRLADDAVQLIDVREKDERDHGFIPGSTHLPYRTVRQAAENGLCGDVQS